MNPFGRELLAVTIRYLLIVIGIRLGYEWKESFLLSTTAFLCSIIPLFWAYWGTYIKRLKLVAALSTPYQQTENEVKAQVKEGFSPPVNSPPNKVPQPSTF